MSDDLRRHWQSVYQTKEPCDVSWYEPVPQRSLELIQAAGLPLDSPILDVGGGASTLVDHLIAAGFTDLTVLDIAPAALAMAEARLGAASSRVQWIAADIGAWQPARQYGLWHDRAVFHFLIDPVQRARYLDTLRATLATGGHVVLACFGPAGPTQCSGLGVQRYSVDELGALLGQSFRLVRSQVEEHVTPAGGLQEFLYGWWQTQDWPGHARLG